MSEFDLKEATKAYAIRLGDDSVVLGHRVSEWCSNGPFLEEDLALQNTALDFVGRARMYFGYAAELANDGSTEDTYAYTRDERQFQNLLIHELPRGDFAYTMVRQLLVDVFYKHFLAELVKSKDETLAGIAAKGIKETQYHLRRSHEWMLRLGDGTEESHNRTQKALDGIWGYTHEMFDVDELEQQLIDAGVGVNNAALKDAWLADVTAIIEEATLSVPTEEWAVRGGRVGYHTENLGHLLTEMQFVHRSYPGQEW